MDPTTRQEKGIALAKHPRIKLIGGTTWKVPSATDAKAAYVVNVAEGVCSCPDYELRRGKCKHLWAVEIVRTVETAPNGSRVVTESVKVTRKTYTQNWAAYNTAQTEEKETVQRLLRGRATVCRLPPIPVVAPSPSRTRTRSSGWP